MMKKYTPKPMKMHTLGFLLMAALFALASCASNPEDAATNVETPPAAADSLHVLSDMQFNSSGMQLGKLEMRTFHEIVKVNGMIDVPPEYRASVSSYFGGTVKSITLIPGEYVKKGQALFVLENPEFVQMQQDYLEAKGQLVYLKSDYERQKNLVQDNVTSQKTYLKSESAYTVTKVKMKSLGKKLGLMNMNPQSLTIENIQTHVTVTSPINGFVTHVNINRGVYLNSSQAAMDIVNTEHLHLELNIFEKDLKKVRAGQAIRFRLQDDDSKTYKAVVHLVNKTVDPELRTIRIHGYLADEEDAEQFNPGMYVEAEIFSTSVSRPALPMNAAVDLEGKYYVLLRTDATAEGYTFVRKEVFLGASNDGFVEIRNSAEFNEDSEILINGAFNLIKE
jgi:cobalt-zinc-cadmium efflux system membrane fusion protein